VSAIEFYSNTLTLAPNYYYIHFRLGMVYEEMSLKHIENSEALLLSAIDQYKLYHEWAPRDLVVLEKLVELQEKIGYPKVDFQVELDSLVNLQAAVAEQLNVSEQQILIGPELLSSGSFLQTGGIINWRVSNMFNSHPFGEALYIVGVDTLDVSGKNYPGRIIGLWKRSQPDQSLPRAGFWAWNSEEGDYWHLSVKQGEVYVVTVLYRSFDDLASFWFSSEPGAFLHRSDYFLPSTQGQAVLFTYVLECFKDTDLSVLVRYWGEGEVYFYEINLRKVVINF